MNEKNDFQSINLNIQPQTNIYALFSRLNYQEWYALAEFVDNSTASYYAHIADLESTHFDKLTIDINYDPTTDTITIEDNAYGMELDDFKRAILLGNAPKQKSRNEFGYGLKTAATWFGNHWTVKSTQLNSDKCYEATIDIDELVSAKKNDTDIIVSPAKLNDHYTKITISKLNRKLNTAKIKKNIVNVLNNMYRRDLKSGKIEIIYNGITLSFGDFPILHFRDKDWKKEISINFDFEGKRYNATGFVGIMEPGGYEKTGFALFRNNRAIICNYKPSEIFGSQAQTQISLKLFGELDMDDFEVNQAKDGFSWSRDLEEKFINHLKAAIPEYIEVAKMSKKEREAEEKPVEIKSVPSKPTENDDNGNNDAGDEEPPLPTQIQINTPSSIPPAQIESKPANSSEPTKFFFEVEGAKYSVLWDHTGTKKFLYEFKTDTNELIINLNHDYIKTIQTDVTKKAMSRILLCYVLSERYAKSCANESGYVQASVLHNHLDEILGASKDED